MEFYTTATFSQEKQECGICKRLYNWTLLDNVCHSPLCKEIDKNKKILDEKRKHLEEQEKENNDKIKYLQLIFSGDENKCNDEKLEMLVCEYYKDITKGKRIFLK